MVVVVNIYQVCAQHAHPADRFAREILGILKCDTLRSRRLMRNPLGRNSQCFSIANLVGISLFDSPVFCLLSAMDSDTLNLRWLTANHAFISACSPCKVLWTFYLNIPIYARHPLRLYQSIETNGGLATDIQKRLIRDLIQHCSPIAMFSYRFLKIYSDYYMSSRAHNDLPPDTAADAAARALILDFQALLSEHLSVLIPSSRSLLNSRDNFADQFEQMLLNIAADHIEQLGNIHQLLTLWINSHQVHDLQ